MKITSHNLMYCFCLIFSITFSLNLSAQDKSSNQKGTPQYPAGDAGKSAGYSYVIIPSVNKTWGYDILRDKKLFIHQPAIPGQPGNEGFKTKVSADTVAKVVIGKIKKGEMPPSVTMEELKKLNVLPLP